MPNNAHSGRAKPAGVAVAALALVWSSAATAQALGAVESALSQLDGELRRVESAYQGRIDLTQRSSFNDRLSQGELFFVLEEWERASLVLGGAVLDPSAAGKPGYEDGLYQLAESLYHLDNLGGARNLFAQLLKRPGHRYRDFAIQRLIAIAERLDDFESLDDYYQDYQALAGGNIPPEIRYLHGKGLFLARRDSEAVDALSVIAPGDAYYLRAQYLIGATLVRADRLDDALAHFEKLAEAQRVADRDKTVMELVHIARGRLLYEMDKLGESIDAYQYVPWDSDLLTTMLYEVTWTYVRRGQVALRDAELSESDREEKALADYELALRQLEDLRALEPDSTRAADFTLLAGQLRLQRGDYAEAEQVFEEVLNNYAAADRRLRQLMASEDRRERIIQDIIAMESGALSVETEMPAVAARRAADNEEVANAIRVFRDIETSRQEIRAAEKMLNKLEALLTSDNRAELFPELREGLTKSYTLSNNILTLRAQIADYRYNLVANQSPSMLGPLKDARLRRKELAAKVATLPTTDEGMSERKDRFDAGFDRLEQELHQATVQLQGVRAQLVAIDLLYGEQLRSTEVAPTALENTRRRIQEFKSILDDLEAQREDIKQELDDAQLTTTMSGGKGAREGSLREAYQRALDEEIQLAASLNTDEMRRAEQADQRAQALFDRNQQFLAKLRSVVDAHVGDVRRELIDERENLRRYAEAVGVINTDAEVIRDAATRIALDHVRAEVHDIVVRADVGIIDVAFARKQRETEKIGRLQRQKSEELTQLNQAYADLTQDEATD